MEPHLAPSPLPRIHFSTIAPDDHASPASLTVGEVRGRMVPLTLDAQTLVNRYLQAYAPSVCELTFANLLHWNETYPHYLGKASPHGFCEIAGHLLIGFSDAQNRLKLYQPIGPRPAQIIALLNAGDQPIEWTCIEESIARSVDFFHTMTYDRDNFDYLYRLDELRALQGKKYHRKRTYIHHCLACKPTVIPLSASMMADCREVNRKWLACKEHPHDTDASALAVALDHFETLGLSGVGVVIDGHLESFSIGEKLNEQTFVSHFLKANYSFPGLFQYTSYALTHSLPPSYQYLNKEQDLGIEGLRTSKEGWCPCGMVRKFTIRNRAWDTCAIPESVPAIRQGPTGV